MQIYTFEQWQNHLFCFWKKFIETDWCFSCKYPWFWRHNYASPKCEFVLESSIWIDIFTGTQICIRILCKLITTWFNWSALDTGSDEGDTVATEGSSRSQHLAMRSNQGLSTIGDCTSPLPTAVVILDDLYPPFPTRVVVIWHETWSCCMLVPPEGFDLGRSRFGGWELGLILKLNNGDCTPPFPPCTPLTPCCLMRSSL